jgi:hypothetical protein
MFIGSGAGVSYICIHDRRRGFIRTEFLPGSVRR